MMVIAGIDPGNATTGFGVIRRDGSRLHYDMHCAITTPPDTPFELRLQQLYEELSSHLDEAKPAIIALEKLFFKQNITTGIAVAQARGVIALAASQRRIPIYEFSPAEVKTGVVGYGKATKRQVQEMVKTILALDSIPRPDDAADALALAICGAHAAKLP